MSGFEVIGVVVSAVTIVTKVVKHFGTPRNAPRQVERLSRMLSELQDERLLQAAKPPERKHISEMINRCTDLLDQEASTGQRSRAWKFFWSTDAENLLKDHNDELDRELDRLQRRVHMYGMPVPVPHAGTSSTAPMADPAPAIRDERERTLSVGSKELGRASTMSWPGPSSFPGLRRASVEALELPTTLSLQNANGQRIGEKLRLQTLTIVERDDMWRRIQYTGRGPGGAQIRVTHRLTRGNIWFEDEDMDDLSVSFLEPHDITVQNAEGFKVYRAFTCYAFAKVEQREQFLIHARERELLGRYFADKIWERGELIAQQKVVRLWKKTISKESQKTTLAFIGRDEKPYERPLVDFRRSPTVRDNKVELIDVVSGMKTTLECRRPPKPPKGKWGVFSSKSKNAAASSAAVNDSDAARFKVAFEANHPATSTFSPLTLGRPPDKLDPDFQSVTGLSPPMPGLTPSTSHAPTLSTLSIPSASISFLPDDPISPNTVFAALPALTALEHELFFPE